MVGLLVDGYVKIDNSNGSFMPIVAEEIYSSSKFKIYSIAHYYNEGGDLLTDPEMCFIYFIDQNAYLACYFKQDGVLAIEQESILVENGEITGIRTKLQAEHTEFANMWLRNIKNQQNL